MHTSTPAPPCPPTGGGRVCGESPPPSTPLPRRRKDLHVPRAVMCPSIAPARATRASHPTTPLGGFRALPGYPVPEPLSVRVHAAVDSPSRRTSRALLLKSGAPTARGAERAYSNQQLRSAYSSSVSLLAGLAPGISGSPQSRYCSRSPSSSRSGLRWCRYFSHRLTAVL